MRFLLTLYCLFSISLFAQISSDQEEKLRLELAKEVNALRTSKGLEPLLFSDTLKAAAQCQANYIADIEKLTHEQKKATLATVDLRVKKFKGRDFALVGENVLSTSQKKFPLKKKDIPSIAKGMFEQWKNSPGHYANMINPEYVFGDFGFAVGKDNRIYAAQVFGQRGVTIDGQLTENAHGLTEYIGDCDTEFGSYVNLVTNMGNATKVEGNEINLYYHNLHYFHKIFPGPNDGVAVDLIRKDQFDCSGPNQLDVSPIHDGILLKPVLQQELWNNNKAESDYRLISRIGTIPEHLNPDDFVPSIVLIRDGKACKYLVPAYKPSKDYDLRPIEPFTLNPRGTVLETTGLIAPQELNYDFKRGITRAIELPTIEKRNAEIASVKVQSFSSIEGDSIKNKTLHSKRATFIKQHVQRTLRTPEEIIGVQAEENWKMMDFQFNYFMADSLTQLSRDSIKGLIESGHDGLPWDSLLFAQRSSRAIINYKGELDTNGVQFYQMDLGLLNLRQAIDQKNFLLANKALYELYVDFSLPKQVLDEELIFQALMNHPELVQNGAALLSKTYFLDLYKTTQFIASWIGRSNELSKEALSNLLHLYTLVSLALLDDWDVPSERLSNVIHPKKVERFMTDNLQPELVLNLHLTFIQYYGQVNDGPGINASFDYITTYFKNNLLSAEDAVALCWFTNSWSRYDLTYDILMPMFERNELNEDGVFALAQTLNFYAEEKEYKVNLPDIHKKAKEMNNQRWCNWLNKDFQILRNPEIKQLFCESCN